MCGSPWSPDPRGVAAVCALLLLAGSATAQEAAATGQLTREPELLEFVEAVYPPEAQAAGEQGSVVLLLTIEADGTVTAAEAQESGGPAFDAAAIEAARRFRFRPAEIDGAPAAVQILYRYEFTLAPPEPPPEPAIPVGRLEGTLLERGTRKPLAGVSVRLKGLDRSEPADAEGRFVFEDVAAGEVTLIVEDPDYDTLVDTETVRAGEATSVRYYVERVGFGGSEVTVVGQRVKKEVVRRRISVQQIRSIPGTNGDALKVVQNLPGAARIPFGAGGIILRGGGDSNVFVNGQPIPYIFHFGGLRSTVGDALIESLDVVPGNYGSRYGYGNGGVVEVELRRPATDGLHGFGQVDVFDATAFLEGPAGEHGAFAVGARRSYIDAILPLALSGDALETFNTAPRYYDYQAVYDHEQGGHRLRALVLGGGDTSVLLLDEPPVDDPYIRDDFGISNDWVTTQLLWDTRLTSNVKHHIGVSYLYSEELTTIGPEFHLEFSTHRVSLRDEFDITLSDAVTLRTGADVDVDWTHADVTAPQPPKEGEPQTPLATQQFIDTEVDVFTARPALWVEADIQLGPVLLIPGVRLDYNSRVEDNAEALLPQPRLNARWDVVDGTTLKGGVGLYSQAPTIDEWDPSFGNAALVLEKSIHYSAGFEQRLTDALSLDVTGFYKDLYDVVAQVDDPAVKYESIGEGRAYGMEVLLKQESERLYGWVAYTLMRSERRDAPGEDLRLFDFDQTHNLTVVAQYKLTTTWEIGGRFRYVTGNPNTPYLSATYDSDADTYVPVPGRINSARNDDFHQLDLRVDKHWVFDTWRLTTYLDVQNVYNRANPEGVGYNYDYTRSTTQGGLPIIPSFGVRGEF